MRIIFSVLLLVFCSEVFSAQTTTEIISALKKEHTDSIGIDNYAKTISNEALKPKSTVQNIASGSINTQSGDYPKYSKYKAVEGLLADPVTIFTGLVAIFTGLLFCATLLVWWSTRKLVIGAEKATEKQLRAYVFTGDVTLQEVTLPDSGLVDRWRATIAWKNAGSTPAGNLVLQTNWDCFDSPMPDNFEFLDKPSFRRSPICLLGPKGIIHGPHIDIPIHIIEKLYKGTQYVYVWGWAEYDDVISGATRHRTEFCVELLRDSGLISVQPYGNFNNFDKGCRRAVSKYRV